MSESNHEALPDGWGLAPVGEVGHVQLGRQRSPIHEQGHHMKPYLRVANVFDGWIDYSDVLGMNFTPHEQDTYGLKPGDILLNEGQSLDLVGRSAIYHSEAGKYCFQNTLVRYRPGRRATPEYCQAVFQRWLRSGRFQIIAKQTTSIAHLGASRFAKMELPLPPRPEQRAIAHVLTTLDDLIADTEAAIAKLEAIRQGLLHDLLTRGLDENGELRPSRPKAGPFNWEPLPFESYLRGTPQNGLYKPESSYTEHGEGAKIVRIDSFNNGDLVRPASMALKTLRVSGTELSMYGLRDGDLLVNRVNSIDWVGKSAMVQGVSGPEVFESNIMRCRLNEERLRPRYALLFVAASWSQSHFRRRAKSAISQASINQGDIRSLAVAVPDVDEQDRVISVIEEFDIARSLAEGSRGVLEGLRAGTRDELLHGRTRVTPELLGLPPEDGDV